MRGKTIHQDAMLSYVSLKDRIPKSHPLRTLVDAVLASTDEEFDAVHARTGRPSVPPERLLKAMLLQILFTLPSERFLVGSIDDNPSYRWFVGLAIDDPVWDRSTFSANRERLSNEGLAGQALLCVAAYEWVRIGSLSGWWNAHRA